ncbi:hypothetical protein BDV12DRAFT_15940 [Aspergillus spectabilis]
MAVCLIDIPNEILHMILAYLDTVSILNVVLTCHRLQDIAEPLLYSEIHLRAKTQPSVMAHLYGTLTTQPHLKDLVTTFISSVESAEALDQVEQLLPLFPSLRASYLNPPPPQLDLTNHRFLHTLDLNYTEYEDWMFNMSDLIRHFFMPSLRSFKIVVTFESGGVWEELLRFLPNSQKSTITDLYLDVYDYDYDDSVLDSISRLIGAVISLKQFTFVVEAYGDWRRPDELMSLDKIIRLPLSYINTLEELTVACSDWGFLRRQSPYASLLFFPNLKRVGIPISFLERYENAHGAVQFALPPHLESLQLQHRARGAELGPSYEVLGILIRMKSSQLLPQLKRVIWWTQMTGDQQLSWRPWSCPLLESLFMAFEEVGVMYQRVDKAYFRETPLAAGRERYEAI